MVVDSFFILNPVDTATIKKTPQTELVIPSAEFII